MHQGSWVQRASLLAALGLSALASPALADGMRCDGKLVSAGDSLFQVRNVCGEPDAASQRRELRAVRRWVSAPCFQRGGAVTCGYMEERVVEIVIHEWIYDFGPSALVKHLTFEEEKLRKVDTGGYGTKPI